MGERRIIRVRYQERPSAAEVGYTYGYLFGSGHAWKGSIASAEVLLVLKGFPPEATVSVMPGFRRKADRFAWRFKNWEPHEDALLNVVVSPHILDITFDKGSPDPPMELNLRGGHLDAILSEIAFWIDASLAWSGPNRTVFVHRKGRTLAVRVGSHEASLEAGQTSVPLPFAPYLDHNPYLDRNQLRVPVRAVCEALGLRVHVVKDKIGNWSVYVLEPQKPKTAADQ